MIIAGAKGFASEVTDVVLEQVHKDDLFFFDNHSTEREEKKFGLYPVLHTIEILKDFLSGSDKRFIIGSGSCRSREVLYNILNENGGAVYTLISNRAYVGHHNNIVGEGSCIMPGVIMEANNVIGKGTLVHVGAFISHDVTIGDFCEISPYSKLLGASHVGNRTAIGTGAIVLPGISVGNNVIVGAGAVVTKDVADNATVVGVPARPIIA